MKKNILIFIYLICASIIQSQNISNARTQPLGTSVTVTGVVTNGDELGPIRYIEDASAGIALYDPTPLSGVLRGQEVTVTGVLVDYNGLLAVTPVNSISINSNKVGWNFHRRIGEYGSDVYFTHATIDWYDSYKNYLSGWFGDSSDSNSQGFNWDSLRELKKMVVMEKLISSTDK